jgi:carbon monoxide dehydrogenase subunit G
VGGAVSPAFGGQDQDAAVVDEIRVEPAGAGAVVTYDARLDMRGALRVANPLLKLAVGRIGDRAAAGLRRALGGEPPRLS